MLTAGKWALTIVAGGLALGALLGGAADPTMKDPAPQWWQLTGHHEIVASSDHAFHETWPEDLNPFTGYRPDLDYDAEAWALSAKAYELAAMADPPVAPAPDDLPSVTYGVDAAAAGENADQAEAAAADALAAEAPGEPAPLEARRPELAAAGIY